MPTNIYHERQTRQLCALHTLNNLFQGHESYTKEQLDQICNDLSPNVWINPHRSPLGLGNYDINVIMTALQIRNCEAIWFDKRKDPSCINLKAIVGFILNVPSDYKFGFVTLPLQRRHWIAIRRIDDKYYNLDSKLREPECIGNETELLSYLRSQLETNKRELFVIVEKSVVVSEHQQPYWLNGEPNGIHHSNINESDCTTST
ncbi:josephin-like protein isoform X1 [Rhagoletis pomonella]|uniref:josephin-like protein isoform X1 n=1 Tax=Rhagoletis pomonella TaxID=28610 RepID=UPI001786C3EC|nr:josephin-like protein isoform X1 [Rhagoletis pomonella]